MISVGTILHDTYRIDSELGRGGMGRVFAASHTRLPRRFAVKVLMQATDGQALKRFRREAEICSQIGHHNIVEVFDFNEVDGQPYIVMELLEGESLRQRFEREPVLASAMTMKLVQEVGRALAAAHGAGVIHRDLKPENIFICRVDDGSEQFKVLDFGISKIMGALSLSTREDMLLGTPGYMSPEQARGDVQSVTAKADQFSLAAIIYEALAGQQAFVSSEDTPYTVLYKIVHREPPPLFGQTAEVQRALARAMSKAADERYDDVAEFVESLTAAMLRVPSTARHFRTPQPAPAPSLRPRWWPLALAGAGLAAAIASGAVVYRVRQLNRAQPQPIAPGPIKQTERKVPPTELPSPIAIAPDPGHGDRPLGGDSATSSKGASAPSNGAANGTTASNGAGGTKSSDGAPGQVKTTPLATLPHNEALTKTDPHQGKAPKGKPPRNGAKPTAPATSGTTTATQPEPPPAKAAPSAPPPATDDELSNPYAK